MRARTITILIIAGAIAGLAAGVGGFTFVYARGGSYLTNDPAACANCHIRSAITKSGKCETGFPAI